MRSVSTVRTGGDNSRRTTRAHSLGYTVASLGKLHSLQMTFRSCRKLKILNFDMDALRTMVVGVDLLRFR